MSAVSAVIQLHPEDDVLIARVALNAGQILPTGGIAVRNDIPAGHKIAVRDIAKGEGVRRYNQIIGFASQPILKGEHVHEHNLTVGDAFARDYAFSADTHPTDYVDKPATFMGIVRQNGQIATRNYIGVLVSVNCAATVARAIADHFRGDALKDYPNVDGVVALTHSSGCASGADSEGMHAVQRTLAGFARHPNFAGVLMVGLGCETNQISTLSEKYHLEEGKMYHNLIIQETGGTAKSIEKGIELVKVMLDQANQIQREPVPASKLVLGLECGGSDGYSGISANPVLGAASDILVRHGGTVVLAETPEIYGAEHLLTRRAVSEAVGQKLVDRINWWTDYCARNKAEMNNNPSAGNKVGGLTTILEKSLGAVVKGGHTNLTAVYEYAEPITERGFVFMDTPGYDPAAITGQIAGGCNIICFTTGRGSAIGSKPAPCVKIATNTAMYQRQVDDMDLNCGTVVDGDATIEEMGEVLFQLLLDVASGKQTKSEEFGYGELEFIPWHIGVMM